MAGAWSASAETTTSPNTEASSGKSAGEPAGAEKKPEKKSGAPKLFDPIVWGCEDEWKLQFSGDTRLRHEYRRNWDMNHDVGDNDHLQFLRTRLDFDLRYRNIVRAFVQVLDARQFNHNPLPAPDPAQEAHFNLLQAFLEIHEEDSPWTIRMGRQILPNLGDRRLLETSTFSNLLRTFEGVWLTHKDSQAETHAFILQNLIYDTIRGDEIVPKRLQHKNHEWLYGMYSTIKAWEPHEIDVYAFGLSDLDDERTFPSTVVGEDGEPGTTDRYTVGMRMRGPLHKDKCGVLGYGLENAYQFGHRANDDIVARMFHADINYEWAHPWKPKVVFEKNIASGDKNPGDGQTNTFSAPFGTTHGPYGIMDFTRLANLREIAATGTVDPTKKLKLQVEFHRFWLDSETDAWYSGVRPSTFGRDRTGRSGSRLGDEIDLIATYKLNECTTLEGGFARFLPGNFARNVGRTDRANYFYIQTAFTF